MPLFGFKKNKKGTRTKDQLSSTSADRDSTNTDDKASTDSSNTAAAAAATPTASDASPVTKTKHHKANSGQTPASSPVRTISQKTPNPFTTKPVNIPNKSNTLETPTNADNSRMYSSSPFSTSPQPPININQHPQQPLQPHLQNVVTGQYNAPPTPPSTARSGSIDDKIDLPSAITTNSQSYQHEQLKHPQPQQGCQQYPDVPSSDAMIGSSSGLLTPTPSVSDRVVPSRFPSAQVTSTLRQTRGKYSIVDFSIQRTLGTGSFGRVHLVQSRHNSRFYAIKVIDRCQGVF